MNSAKLKTLANAISAEMLESINETIIDLDSNHCDMGKYENRDDQNYAQLRWCIIQLMRLTTLGGRPREDSSTPFRHRERSISNTPTTHSANSEQSPRTEYGRERDSVYSGSPVPSISTTCTSHVPSPKFPEICHIPGQSISIPHRELRELVVQGDVSSVKLFIQKSSDVNEVRYYITNTVGIHGLRVLDIAI